MFVNNNFNNKSHNIRHFTVYIIKKSVHFDIIMTLFSNLHTLYIAGIPTTTHYYALITNIRRLCDVTPQVTELIMTLMYPDKRVIFHNISHSMGSSGNCGSFVLSANLPPKPKYGAHILIQWKIDYTNALGGENNLWPWGRYIDSVCYGMAFQNK